MPPIIMYDWFVSLLFNIFFFFFFLKLPVETRKEMTTKAIRTVRDFIEKPRKRNSKEDLQEASDSEITYADALNHLEKSLAHLETLNHTFIISLKNSEQVVEWNFVSMLAHSDNIRIFFHLSFKAV